MLAVRKSDSFEKWIRSLKDKNAVARINIRIKRLQLGNPGDFKSVGNGLSELRIDYGPGYRIYFSMIKNVVILLINGGDKSTQKDDIIKAKRILSVLEVENE